MERVLTDSIANAIISVSPYYNLRTASCQTFAVDLALRIVESPNSVLSNMKTEQTAQTALRMRKGKWDENTLDRSVDVSHSLATSSDSY